MIIFFENGRLGNQLFQYCAMRAYQRESVILAIGMSDINAGFDGVKLINSDCLGTFLDYIFRKYGKIFFGLFSGRRRLFTLVEEIDTPNGVSYSKKRGLIRNILYFKPGYYQSENVVKTDITKDIVLKEALVQKTRELLDPLSLARDRFFVHVRRGDYTKWPSAAAPAVLNLEWYLLQMDRIRQEQPNAFFIVVSDDPPYVKEFFSDCDDVAVICEEPLLDFSVLTQCQGGGILSASSFAWWGAYFVKRENPDALLIAPRYWVGHRSKKWFPRHIQTSWLTYAET